MTASTTLWTVVAVLLVLWLLGLLAGVGPLINLLLVAAAAVLFVEVLRDRGVL